MTNISKHTSLVVGCATDRGPYRNQNEDSYGVIQTPFGDCFIVCDGMGGHAAGHIASQVAVQEISAYFHNTVNHQESNFIEILYGAVQEAHDKVYWLSTTSSELTGMGTTVVLMCVYGNVAYIAHLGDSRAYVIRDLELIPLTQDHDRVSDLFARGLISKEEYHNHPERGVLSKALGITSQGFKPEITQIQLSDHDTLILCTDGAYNSFERQPNILSQMASVQHVLYGARNLIEFAVQTDGQDNATIILARYLEHVPSQIHQVLPSDLIDAPNNISTPKLSQPYGSIMEKTNRSRTSDSYIPMILLIILGIVLGYSIRPDTSKNSANINPSPKISPKIKEANQAGHKSQFKKHIQTQLNVKPSKPNSKSLKLKPLQSKPLKLKPLKLKPLKLNPKATSSSSADLNTRDLIGLDQE